MPPALRVVDLTVVRGDDVVLRRLGLDVPHGSTTVLLGPSGSGKTTLLRCMAGLGGVPDGGLVAWDGRDLADLHGAELQDLRRSCGVALGGSSLFGAWTYGSDTVAEQVARTAGVRGCTEDETRSEVAQCLHDLDLAGRGDLLPDQLAAHTRRRLAIAMALVGRPRLILLDAPETACDTTSRESLLDAIRRAGARPGSTLVVATGDLEIARALGGRLGLLIRGTVGVLGEADTLLNGVHDATDLADRYPDDLVPAGPLPTGDGPSGVRRGRTVEIDLYVLLLASIVLLAVLAAVVHPFGTG